MASQHVILVIVAHPDDETSAAGGTMTKYAAQGVDIHVVTATRGEMGILGTGGLTLTREELPAQRERELREVLALYGVNPPTLLGYRDQEVKDADLSEITGKVLEAMRRVQPDVVITFGPMGISGHDDHVTMHRAAVEAFHQYRRHRAESPEEPRLFYVAIPRAMLEEFEIPLDGPETDPTVVVDISETKAVKIKALRTYRSQEDAQQLADLFESAPWAVEAFHQAYPPAPDGEVADGFWQ